MPKAASPITPTKARRTGAGSPAKRSSRKKQTIQVQDRSQWRSSWIRENVTITKTVAIENYHMSAKYLQDIPYAISETAKKIQGVDRIMPKFLYKERDVERRAWEKYGGPEGFEKMLNKKADKYYKKHGEKSGKIFPKPNTYELDNNPALEPCVSVFVRPKHIPDIETSTPTLIRIKEKMEGRGEKWLWDALNNWLKEYEPYLGGERESLMLCTFNTLRDYPMRPTSPPPSDSISFKALNELLAGAPSGHGPGVDEDNDYFEGDRSVDWVEPYKNNVYDCLDEVLHEQGVDGLKKAQWLVYDKYVECEMGGLACYKSDDSPGLPLSNEYQWSDSAKFWLQERED